jgi:hypothetical protein
MSQDYFKQCIEKLKLLTGKKYIFITSRCNNSINQVLKYSRKTYDEIYFQDQGGWITYEQYAKKLKFKINVIKTDICLIPDNFMLNNNQKNNSVLIYNSMPAYAFLQDLSKINNKIFTINDACGSIGTNYAKIGDFIVCSFGRWKPINLGKGGFIATNVDDFQVENYMDLDFKELFFKLSNLNKRIMFIKKIRNKVLKDLHDFDIIRPEVDVLNVIVRFNNTLEREKLINYCLINNLEYTLCPKNIRVNVDAISIEIKRLEE